MVRMIMHGCGGAMGQVITGLAAEDDSIEIVAGIDLHPSKDSGYPVFNSLDQCNVKADVIVDFSSAKAVDGLLKYCSETGMPVVLCTTGLSKGQLETLKRASASAAVLRSANMSLGVNLLLKLVKDAANTTTRRWTRPAARPLHWRIPLTRPWTCLMGIPMTEVPAVKKGIRRKSA